MKTSNTVILNVGIVGFVLLAVAAAYHGFYVEQPLRDQQNAEQLTLINTFSRIENDTNLTFTERLDLLKSHHLLTPEQDSQMILLQDAHSSELRPLVGTTFTLVTFAFVILIGGGCVVVCREPWY